MRLLLVGYGRMGRLVGELAADYGCEVLGIVDPVSAAHSGDVNDPRWRDVDVAIDFTSPDAVLGNVSALARRRINVVLGTTGWQRHEPELRRVVAEAGSGIVAAPCGAPVFAAVLTWVATTRSGVLGFTYLFVFSLGMTALLVVVGLFSGTLSTLPRAGAWMAWIKKAAGVILLGMAEYYFIQAGMVW